MSRRKSLLDEVAGIPWWIGVGISVLSFIAVCVFDRWLIDITKSPEGSSPVGIMKFFVPAMFLGAAAVSWLNSRKRA